MASHYSLDSYSAANHYACNDETVLEMSVEQGCRSIVAKERRGQEGEEEEEEEYNGNHWIPLHAAAVDY